MPMELQKAFLKKIIKHQLQIKITLTCSSLQRHDADRKKFVFRTFLRKRWQFLDDKNHFNELPLPVDTELHKSSYVAELVLLNYLFTCNTNYMPYLFIVYKESCLKVLSDPSHESRRCLTRHIHQNTFCNESRGQRMIYAAFIKFSRKLLQLPQIDTNKMVDGAVNVRSRKCRFDSCSTTAFYKCQLHKKFTLLVIL